MSDSTSTNESVATPRAKEREIGARGPGLEEHAAKFRKISVPSTDLGTYDFTNPNPRPNTAEENVSTADMQYIYMTNAVVHKAINLRANRVIGDGFELLPSDQPGADKPTSEHVCDISMEFLKKLNYKSFFKGSCINAYVGGNEWSELIYNRLKSMVDIAHGDFNTIDFRRNFINNKIIIGSDGQPAGYWQYIADLSQLYYSLSSYYGEVPAWENLEAAKNRLKESQSLSIQGIDPNTGQPVEVGVMFATTKPNFQFLKKNEIAHLAFNTLNDNFYGISLILPAYNAVNHLEQVMYATAEAINDMGFPKLTASVGDEKHEASKTLMDQAESLIANPTRKESYAVPYPMKLSYLEPGTTGQSNIAQYPEWFINEVAVGLRVPKELLIGGGDANRATAETNSSDFDRDIEADRANLEKYIYKILNLFLESRGFIEGSGQACIYLPKIKWPALITADGALREKMAIERWNADIITFNELRQALDMNEIEDMSRADKYKGELSQAGAQPAAGGPAYGGMLSSEDGLPTVTNPLEKKPPITGKVPPAQTAQFKLDVSNKQNEWLNKNLMTQGVDYEDIAKSFVGKKIKSVSKAKAKLVRDAIVNGEAQKKPVAEILKSVMKIGGYSDKEARVIFWTEHKSFVEHGGLEDMKNRGYTHKKWASQMDKDTSPLCKALHGKVVPIDGDFEATYTDNSGKSRKWRGKAPAAHPNCRSHLAYGKTARFEAEKAYNVFFRGFQIAVQQNGPIGILTFKDLPEKDLDKVVMRKYVTELTEMLSREYGMKSFHIIPTHQNWFEFMFYKDSLEGLENIAVTPSEAEIKSGPTALKKSKPLSKLASAWKSIREKEKG